MKNIFTLLLITAISFTSYAQEWETVENRGPDGCYTTQIIETIEIKKKTALDSEKYQYIIKITFENPLDVGISFDFRYHDSYGENTGRITLKPGKKTTSEAYREISRSVDWNTALNIQPIETSKLRYIDFEILGEQIWQSKYINCLEHFHIYKKKKMKEIRDKKENGHKDEKIDNNEQTTNTSKKEVDNENQGYQVLDVDTSEFESEKERKRQEAERQRQLIYDQNKRDSEYQARKTAFEREKLAKLNRSTQAYEQRQANLTNAGNQIKNNIDNIFAQAAESRAREDAIEEERLRQIKADREAEAARRAFEYKEEQLRKEREREAKKAKEERIVFLRESRNKFSKTLNNQHIPVQVNTAEVFFFMVNSNGREIIFAPFKVLADENKQIPYANEIINDFHIKTGEYGYKIYGPYNSKLEQENAIKTMTAEAMNIEITRKEDLKYIYIQKKKTSEASSNKDFWGNEEDATKEKKKTTTFWDN